MDIIKNLKDQLSDIIANIDSLENSNIEEYHRLISKSSIEPPKNQEHGCLAYNGAMIMAKFYKKKPRELAEIFKTQFLSKIDLIDNIEIAGPGFMNFKFHNKYWHNILNNIIKLDKKYGQINIGNNEKINIEFGSPNPTGPLHVGHVRGAVFGDVLANILAFLGYDVTRENYINDAGSQINILAKSLFLRYQEIVENISLEIPKGLYPGPYLIPIAQKIYDIYKDKYIKMAEEEYLPFFKKEAVESINQIISNNFLQLKIKHDISFSEKSLHDENKLELTKEILKNKNLLYVGTLPKPKSSDNEQWDPEPQLLFKSSQFGDDIDRVIEKADGKPTYFAADCAYHYDKISRGFNKLILVLGADHGGYIKRMKSMVRAISDNNANIEIKLCQLVNLIENGKTLKMSKRDGSYITASDVIEKVGSDALRFIMLTRKTDAILDFDLELAIEQSKENPIFYIQYAHARICSVLSKCENKILQPRNDNYLDKLNHISEINLIKHLALFPQTLQIIANNYDVHHLTYYLIELSSKFHTYWNLGNGDNTLKIITENLEVSQARVKLLESIKNTISNGLALFSIKALEKM